MAGKKVTSTKGSDTAKIIGQIKKLTQRFNTLEVKLKDLWPGSWPGDDCPSCEYDCEGGCTGSCTGGCEGSSEGWCGGSCTLGCIGGCEAFCEGGCQTGCECGCEFGCLESCTSGCTGCESGCQTACESGCESGCTSQSCEGGCETQCEVGDTVGFGQWQCFSGDMMVDINWWAQILNPSIFVTLPESNLIAKGDIQECPVRIEPGIAVLSPDTEVTVRLKDGSLVKAKSISSWMIRFTRPVEAFVALHGDKKKQRVVGGELIEAEGLYKKGMGITIPKGTVGKVRFKSAVYSGKIEEDTTISVARLSRRLKRFTGIRRITK